MKRVLLFMFWVIASASLATAKGTADQITITTPGGQTIALTNPEVVAPISMAALEQFPQAIAAPSVSGKGYEVVRAYKVGRGYRIFDRVRYYPDGDHGYVYYVGIENGSSEYDGKWFEATSEGATAMNEIIKRFKPPQLHRLNIVVD